jgi:hypothetical protein
MINPPIQKGFIGDDVEALFGERGFSESVRDISAKNEKVLSCSNRIENPCASLIDTVSVCFVQYSGLTRAGKPSHVQRALYRPSRAFIT